MHLSFKRVSVVFILICLLFPQFLYCQQKAVRKAERKKELMEKLDKKYYLKSRKKAVRHRKEIQSGATRERMKEADKRAKRFNRGIHTGWIEEHFKCKKPKR